MMINEESTKIINFMTLGAGIRVLGRGHIVNMQYVYTRTWSRQIKYKARMTRKGLPRAGGLMLGHGYMNHYNEYALSSLYQYTSH